MLKIRKDNIVQIVSAGTYENLYKGMGYEIVSEGKKEAPAKVEAPSKPTTQPEEQEPKEDKKPVFKKESK